MTTCDLCGGTGVVYDPGDPEVGIVAHDAPCPNGCGEEER